VTGQVASGAARRTDTNAKWQGQPSLVLSSGSLTPVACWLERAGDARGDTLCHSLRQLNPVSWIPSSRINPIRKRLLKHLLAMKGTRLHHEIQNPTEGYHITEQRFLAVLLRLGIEVKKNYY